MALNNDDIVMKMADYVAILRYGCDPDTVPMDLERVLPMLGFHGLAVTHGAGAASL